MIIDNEPKLDFADVLLVPNRSNLMSRSQVGTTVDFFEHEVCPVIAANMDGVGTFEMANALAKHKMMTALVKHYSIEDLVEFYANNDNGKYAIYSMGTSDKDYEKLVAFTEDLDAANHGGDNFEGPLALCVDVANGYTTQFEDFCAKVSENFPQFILIAGNVVTPERVEQLFEVGVDIVKIGIGPGSVCTTRKLTGVGYPQLSAVIECGEIARDYGGRIISDGGCTCPGDVAKAFAAGADMVMLGGMFAGHKESGGDVVNSAGRQYVKFYGMSSKTAQDIHNGGVANYRASEGKEVLVPYRGPVEATIKDLLGGIRSTCTYLGAEDITQLHRKAKFIRVNRVLNNVFGNDSI